ncbi:MAG: response regulator [Clostridia bacterium]|nr:response regulator [Clostridia bacterium]
MNAELRLGVKNLIVLMAVIFGGFILMLVIHNSFLKFEANIDFKLDNQDIEISIGQNILNHLQVIETQFYEIALGKNVAFGEITKENILLEIKHLKEAFVVLVEGGEIVHHIELNLAGKDKYEEIVSYMPTDHRDFSIVAIDLNPKLDLTIEKIDELLSLLSLYEEVLSQGPEEQLSEVEDSLNQFMKYMPPHFIRMKENASRIIYESKIESEAYKDDMLAKKALNKKLELAVSIMIFIVILVFGYFFGKKIVKINHKLSDYAFKAEQASIAKTLFVTSMSHEIRTPLNAILGFSEILEGSTALPEKEKEFIQIITRSGKSLLNIVNDVLDFSKIESQNLVLEHISFNIHDLLEEVIELYSLNAQEKKIKLAYQPDTNMPMFLYGDPNRLKQVLINLISNGIKFTNQKGTVSLITIVKSHEEESTTLRFIVNDNGIGISPEDQGRIFEPFEQAELGTTRKYGGTGLGLVISSHIVEAMGGKIHLTSALDVGSSFAFDIPFEIDYSSEIASMQNQWEMKFGLCCKETTFPNIREQIKKYLLAYGEVIEDFEDRVYDHLNGIFVFYNDDIIKRLKIISHVYPEVPIIYAGDISLLTVKERVYIRDVIDEPIYNKKIMKLLSRYYDAQISPVIQETPDYKGRILVVEDNQVNQHLIGVLLDKFNLKVVYANHGEEALRLYKSELFDLILMDLHMPVMDGFDAARNIRNYNIKQDLDIPIIALTADVLRLSDDPDRLKDFDGYLSKPVEINLLKEVLHQYLKPSEIVDEALKFSKSDYDVFAVAKELDIDSKDLLSIIEDYYLEIFNKIDTLYHLLESGSDEIQYELHSMLGSTANLRFIDAAEQIRKMETVLRDEQLKKEDIEALENMLVALKKIIENQILS